MKPRQSALLGLMAGIIATGCAGTNKPFAPTITQVSTSPGIQQIGYGPDARFTWCSGDRCPTRTIKTLAQVERPPAAAVIAPTPVAPASAARPVAEIHKLIIVPFETGSARLSDRPVQAIYAAFAVAMHALRIVIRGRTDSTGSARSNDRLAERRAEAVRAYLTKTKLGDSIEIAVESKGSCCYAADNHSASGRAANRRVEVEVLVVSP